MMPASSSWRALAVCRGLDTEMFYGGVADVAAAQAVCATCPVSSECLDFAIDGRERFGIFGGVEFKDGTALRMHKARQREAS